jgi:preprotein translocase subunit SecA
MSNPASLLHGKILDLADTICIERTDARESPMEERLRKGLAQLPQLSNPRSRIKRFVAMVNKAEERQHQRSDEQLRRRFQAVCRKAKADGLTDEVLAKAFAQVREAARRSLGMRHHDVQLVGGWALVNGMVAEMATGEGKTLVATLAASTVAAAGAVTHVITVNDYLAERDAANNAPLFTMLGLTVGAIKQDMSLEQRREIYQRDVVYVSNKEIVFDYLKDQIAIGRLLASQQRLRAVSGIGRAPELLLRGLHYAIVDEVDSVLVDEARTPLIISESVDNDEHAQTFATSLELAAQLTVGADFEITRNKDVWLSATGQASVTKLCEPLGGVWNAAVWRNELVQKALVALHCFRRDEHYIVADGKVQIVDEFTGRVMPDRSWENGLHQMIEAKEGCDLSAGRRTLSRMTYQRFFRRYLRLSGMTGTAAELKRELKSVYGLKVLRIQTHRPVQRQRLADRCWLEPDQRWQAVVDRASTLAVQGRAVLIGTRSVEASELLASQFALKSVAHTILNARQDQEEAQTVGFAGEAGRITIATNMAGRGTDIRLSDDVRAQGGLHVILTEFHESARVDRQLFGRSARQGDPGSAEAMVCLQDELFSRYGALWVSFVRSYLGAGKVLPTWLCHWLVSRAQSRAERYNAQTRRATMREDKRLQSLLAFAGKTN